ncbi:thiopurine S-methyltransferase [Pseudomonas sp. RIT-PI-AD]|uniref:thiopurine S-methyltransferase n=1 Tax=Pseudomonas sp. RIT-PI-AD TaxID=3035294 RepID=UPI0021DA3B8C|nr:thiopurine S-methyltransferase [Pseudomonas sp. RIT-PI-AD]
MDPAFWQRRWTRNEIGFHLNEVNPYLIRHWPSLGLASGSRVLVPLCGKTLDMAWLAHQGHRVLGVELMEKAVQDFFAEQGLQAEMQAQGAFVRYRAAGLELWCGDFFSLTAEDVADCSGLYDRAALIALPADMRARYRTHLAAILPTPLKGLLITLDYEQDGMAGPPFAVSDAEVREGYAPAFGVELLESPDVLAENWKFLKRGLDRLEERIYRIDR